MAWRVYNAAGEEKTTGSGGGGGIGGAPTDATYITATANSELSAEQLLSAVIGRGTLVSRPAAGVAGRVYYVTDSGDQHWTRDTGSAWEDCSPDWTEILNKPTTFAPTSHGDISHDATVASLESGKVPVSELPTLDLIPAPVASLPLNSQKITGLAEPTAASDAATKNYADAVASGLDVKSPVRVATTANITLSGAQTIDGVSVVASDRVLVKNQTTGSQNGIYVCASGAWTRSTDADVDAEVISGMFALVQSGTTQTGTSWVLTTNNPITLGTTSLSFAQFSAAVVVHGDSLHDATVASLAAGKVPVSELAAGTPDGTKFLRDDQTWQVPLMGGVDLPPYTISNVTTDRTYDANVPSLNEISDVLGTLIDDLESSGGGGTGSSLFFNVKDAPYNATGLGIANDQVAIQAAVDACIAAGGGIVFFPAGTYRIVCTAGGTGGQGYGIVVDGDNVTLMGVGPGTIIKPEMGAAAVGNAILVSGGAKVDRAQNYHHWHQDELGYKINAAARSASSITLSVAGSVAHGGFAVGDYIYIRTGQLIHNTGGHMDIPSAELNVVQAVLGEVITLRYPLSKPYDQEYYQGNFATAVTSGTHSAGATVLNVVSTTGWSVRDTIRILGAGPNGNDYFSTVSALTGTTLTIEQPLSTGASVANGTTVYNGRTSAGVVSSTAVTAHLVPMLVAKVNHITVSNFAMRDLAFAQSTVNHLCNHHGVHQATIERIFGYWYKNGVCSGINFRRYILRDCAMHATGAGVNFGGGQTPFSPSTGCSDLICTDNFFSSEGHCCMALVEGNTGISILNNVILSAPNTTANHNITCRTRGWDIKIVGNTVVNGASTGVGIFVDPAVTGGVIIEGNTVRGSMGSGIMTQAINVTLGYNDVQSGLAYRAAPGVGLARPGPVYSLSDWVTTAEQTVTIGEIPAEWYVHGVDIQVSVAFNSGGTDQIEVGYTGADTAFATLTDVSTTGVKAVTLGTGIGRQTVLRSVVAKYLAGGTAPTTGKAVVIVRYSLIPMTP